MANAEVRPRVLGDHVAGGSLRKKHLASTAYVDQVIYCACALGRLGRGIGLVDYPV